MLYFEKFLTLMQFTRDGVQITVRKDQMQLVYMH